MTSAAAPRHPVDALREDHRRAQSLIRLLSEQVEGAAKLRTHDIEIAQAVFRYMVEFVDNQHHAREDLLIQLLSERNPAAGRRIRQADQEHDRLRQDGAEMVTLLGKLVKRRTVPGGVLARRIRHYGETLSKHFEHEESRFFAVAEASLLEGDWKTIAESGSERGDPLFGAEVEKGFETLFDTYVNHINAIGTPRSRHATVSAAAIVDAAAAAISGSRAIGSAMRGGASSLVETHRAGSRSLLGSRSLSEFCDNALSWSRSSFHSGHSTSASVVTLVHDTMRGVVSPLGGVLDTRFREFRTAHPRNNSQTSLRSQFVNLALRATVKRMANSASFDEFETSIKNIEIPRSAIDRLIPALAKDIEVTRVELDTAFAEVIEVRDAPVSRTILFFPGGGFMMAPTQAHRLVAARLARGASARVVLVHYRLAPEYRFPAGLDDCVEAYRHLLREGVDPKSMVLVGDSAGGAMALSSLLRIRDEGLPLPAGGVLLSPVTDLSYSGASRQHNSWSDPSMPRDERNIIAQVYLGNVPKDDPLASPLFADLSGLPPMLIQVGSIEVLLDDALRVAAKIRAQGGECECEVWHDMPHDWMLFSMLPEARKAQRRIIDFIDEKIGQPTTVHAVKALHAR